MKKIILTILFVLLLLAGCTSKPSLLIKISDNPILSKIDDVYIDSIAISSEDYSIFNFLFDDSENYLKAKEAIKKIDAVKGDGELTGEPINVEMFSESDYVMLSVYDNGVKVIDTDQNVALFKSDNASQIKEELTAIGLDVDNHHTSDGELLFEDNGFSAYCIGSEVNEKGEHTIDIQFINESDKSYEVVMNTSVNGVYTHGFSSYFVMAQDSIGYTFSSGDYIYQSFTGLDAASVYYSFDIYEADSQSYETLGYLFSSDSFLLFDDGSQAPVLDNPLYEDEFIKLYVNSEKEDIATNVLFAIENKKNEDISVYFKSYEANGEIQEDVYPERSLNIPVKGAQLSFASMPIYTFDFDENSGELSYYDLDSLSIIFEIQDGDMIAECEVTVK